MASISRAKAAAIVAAVYRYRNEVEGLPDRVAVRGIAGCDWVAGSRWGKAGRQELMRQGTQCLRRSKRSW